MSKTANTDLAAFRKRIDEIDDKIVALLQERLGVVSEVGEMKRATAPGICPIRAGREAEQLRRIMKQFEQSGRKDALLPAAAASLWRTIIGLSTSIESPLKLSAFTPPGDDSLYWLAREYFGSFTPVIKQTQIKRVVGDLLDGKAAVGIVPIPRSTDATNWWLNFMDEGDDVPKIFARIPFVNFGSPGRDAPAALAAGRLVPEPSGDDISLWVLEADHNVSQHRLQSSFVAAKLEVNWVNVTAITPITRHHLIELNGFITAADERMKALISGLGMAIINAGFLGAYAVPVTLGASETKESHVAASKI